MNVSKIRPSWSIFLRAKMQHATTCDLRFSGEIELKSFSVYGADDHKLRSRRISKMEKFHKKPQLFLCKYLFSSCLNTEVHYLRSTPLPNGEFGGEVPEKGAGVSQTENSPLPNGAWHKVAKPCGTRGFAREIKKPSGWFQTALWYVGGARNRIRTCDLYRVKIAF